MPILKSILPKPRPEGQEAPANRQPELENLSNFQERGLDEQPVLQSVISGLMMYVESIMSLLLALFIPGASIMRVGNKTDAIATPARNKAERSAMVETIQGKVASMGKSTLAVAEEKSDKKKTTKKKARLFADVVIVWHV